LGSVAVSAIVAVCVFAGAILAMCAARALPSAHLSTEGRDVIKLAMALIATLVALVLGLLIATAKGTFDAQTGAVRQQSANIILLDRILAGYGPETEHPRALLQQSVVQTIERMWPKDGSSPAILPPHDTRSQMLAVYNEVANLSPQGDAQRSLKARALQAMTDLAQTRFQMYVQENSGLPLPFLIVVVFWLIILFAGYGLIAPRNGVHHDAPAALARCRSPGFSKERMATMIVKNCRFVTYPPARRFNLLVIWKCGEVYLSKT
jgi:hypothetical protein